jgi:hypothetical protein
VVIEVSRRPRQVTECNCSICRRYGTLWAYYSRTSVRIVAAPTAQSTYAWGDKLLDFYRCGCCGCVTHWLGRADAPDARMGVNARLFAPDIVAGLRVRHLDGADTWKFRD